jgi:hypothetical protein
MAIWVSYGNGEYKRPPLLRPEAQQMQLQEGPHHWISNASGATVVYAWVALTIERL